MAVMTFTCSVRCAFLAVLCLGGGTAVAQEQSPRPTDPPAAEAAQLPGTSVELSAAMKSGIIFYGKVTDISEVGNIKAAGASAYHGTKVSVQQVLKGAIDNPAILEIHVRYRPREEPPKKDGSYIFFVDVVDGVWNEVSKIMPATDENIAKVAQLLPKGDAAQTGDFYCGGDLPAQSALVESDAIFTGEIVDPGAEDHGDSFSYAYAGKRLAGVKIKVGQVLRGRVDDKISVTLFVNFVPKEVLKGPYIFYVKNNEGKAGDAFTVLKLLPATAGNISDAKGLINPPGEYTNKHYRNLKE